MWVDGPRPRYDRTPGGLRDTLLGWEDGDDADQLDKVSELQSKEISSTFPTSPVEKSQRGAYVWAARRVIEGL
jgi:hypothetical protein